MNTKDINLWKGVNWRKGNSFRVQEFKDSQLRGGARNYGIRL